MTLWDDVPTLLTKLRHTFITTDDTGLSEMVITEDTVTNDDWNIKDNCLNCNRKNGMNKISISPDIYPEVDYGARRQRRRSQTDERLEKLKRDKLESSTEHVVWKAPSEMTESDREDIFARKEVTKASICKKSSLSVQLANSLPDLPFREFAKFDSLANPGGHAKGIEILTTMSSADSRHKPLRVVVLNSATVRETIGLTCWLYTRAGRTPPLMMPWQGDSDNMIDRFDVRAHLDIIPKPPKHDDSDSESDSDDEDKTSNYERYRTLVQNECAGLSEEACLKQIEIEEQFGALEPTKTTDDKKKFADKKAAIGYVYDDGTETAGPSRAEPEGEASDAESELSVSEMDLDVVIDIDELTEEQRDLMNQCATQFGMRSNDMIRQLEIDKEEAEQLRQAKLAEEEKAQFTGRKSRRERRAIKDKLLANRKMSPPSYAARDSPKYEEYKRASTSRSRSRSPDVPAPAKFITSFGGDSSGDEKFIGPELPPTFTKSEQRPKLEKSLDKHNSLSKLRRDARNSSRSISRSRSRSRSRGRRRSRSRSRDRRRSRSRGRRSRSRSRTRRFRSRSRSRSRGSWSRSRRSRSRSRRSRTRSRSRSSDRRKRRRYSTSRSRSRSTSRSRRRTRSSSRNSSRSPVKSTTQQAPSYAQATQAQPPVKRYRRDDLSSGNELSDSDNEAKTKNEPVARPGKPGSRALGYKAGGDTGAKLTAREKLRRRMQAALNKQYKQDKRAETEKKEKLEQAQLDREEEMRAIAAQMRKRERERKYREQEEQEALLKSERGRRSRSTSRSKSSSASRSRSRSPVRRGSPSRRSPPRRSPPSRRSRSPPLRRSPRSPPRQSRNGAPYRRRRSRSRSRSASPVRPRHKIVDY